MVPFGPLSLRKSGSFGLPEFPPRPFFVYFDPFPAGGSHPSFGDPLETDLRPGSVVNKLQQLWGKPERLRPAFEMNIQRIVAGPLPYDGHSGQGWSGFAIDLAAEPHDSERLGFGRSADPNIVPERDRLVHVITLFSGTGGCQDAVAPGSILLAENSTAEFDPRLLGSVRVFDLQRDLAFPLCVHGRDLEIGAGPADISRCSVAIDRIARAF